MGIGGETGGKEGVVCLNDGGVRLGRLRGGFCAWAARFRKREGSEPVIWVWLGIATVRRKSTDTRAARSARRYASTVSLISE